MNLYEYQSSRSFIDLGPRSLRFNILFFFFFLETAWPIEAKFYVEPPWDGGKKVWSNGLYHMTKLAAMPIYGKNIKKSSALESKGWWPWKLVCSIGYSSTTKFGQLMSLGWPWPVLVWSLVHLYGKKAMQRIFFRNNCSLLCKCW